MTRMAQGPRVLAVNPGGMTTKIAVYEGEDRVFDATVEHSREDLDGFDARPHAVGVNLDETKAARSSPVARGNLYLRHLLFLHLRVDVSVR